MLVTVGLLKMDRVPLLTRSILSDGTPVSPRQQSLIVTGLVMNVVCENGNGIFVRIRVHVMHPVALVEHVGYHIGFRCISNCRGDNIWHVSVIPVFGQIKFRIRKELSNGCQMDIATVMTRLLETS